MKRMHMHVREAIERSVAEALKKRGIDPKAAVVEHTDDFSHGDYATGAALQFAKESRLAPQELARTLVVDIGSIEGVSRIEIAPPGFINFHLDSKTLAASVAGARTNETWGANNARAGQKIMVEYTDPNPFKEFHIGHLMSNAIGESIARLVEYCGAQVRRANYQGDVGLHVAKALWAVAKFGCDPKQSASLGEAYARGARAYEEDAGAKREIDEVNAKIYSRSDPALNELCAEGKRTSLAHFETLYAALGTKFEHYFFESETGPLGKRLVEEHPELFEKSDGAVVFRGDEARGLHTRVFINSEGLPTYEAKELGLAKMKYDAYPYDLSIVVTGNEVNEYFRVLLDAMAKIFPDLARKTVHISHGMMRLSSGKMSSRTGDVITGESLLGELVEQAKERAKESRAEDAEKLSEQVAVGAVKYQILRQATGRNIVFDRARALSLEGDSGPYLQYAHARAHQIIERARVERVPAAFDEQEKPSDIARLIHRFPEIVERAASEYQPHLVTTYAISLAAAFNGWYAKEQILDGTPSAPHKVAITDAFRATLKNALSLLGISTPEKM